MTREKTRWTKKYEKPIDAIIDSWATDSFFWCIIIYGKKLSLTDVQKDDLKKVLSTKAVAYDNVLILPNNVTKIDKRELRKSIRSDLVDFCYFYQKDGKTEKEYQTFKEGFSESDIPLAYCTDENDLERLQTSRASNSKLAADVINSKECERNSALDRFILANNLCEEKDKRLNNLLANLFNGCDNQREIETIAEKIKKIMDPDAMLPELINRVSYNRQHYKNNFKYVLKWAMLFWVGTVSGATLVVLSFSQSARQKLSHRIATISLLTKIAGVGIGFPITMLGGFLTGFLAFNKDALPRAWNQWTYWDVV